MNERKTLCKNSQNELEIGGVSCKDLVANFGTPLYVIDQEHVENMCKIYADTLKNEYGDGIIYYASKAFSCKYIYRVVNSMGIGADVVSGGEIYTALKAGFPMQKLCFHGNNKLLSELQLAIDNNVGTIVIDSYGEADLLEELLQKANKTQNVLIRVNPGVEAHTHHFIQTATVDSKFGFSIDSGEASNIIKHVLSKKHLNLKGLHCHIGSQIFEEKCFVLAVQKMANFYAQIKKDFSYEFDCINLGGGFGIYYAEGDAKKDVNEYANFIKIIAKTLIECVDKLSIKKPYLMLEPGRSIIGEAGITLYQAGRIKHIEGVKDYIAIDGGMFDNPRFALYQAKYTVLPINDLDREFDHKYTIAGKCCESGDIIAEDCPLPKINEGDYLAVLSTGAYNYSMSSNYNRNLIPPVIAVKNGEASYVVKPQTYDDIIRNDL